MSPMQDAFNKCLLLLFAGCGYWQSDSAVSRGRWTFHDDPTRRDIDIGYNEREIGATEIATANLSSMMLRNYSGY